MIRSYVVALMESKQYLHTRIRKRSTIKSNLLHSLPDSATPVLKYRKFHRYENDDLQLEKDTGQWQKAH